MFKFNYKLNLSLNSKLLKALNPLIWLITATSLTACGGSAEVEVVQLPAPTVISQTNANSALTLAKNNGQWLSLSLAHSSDVADILRTFTSPAYIYTGAGGSTPISQSCGITGNVVISYAKTTSAFGLNAGDSFIVSYSNCKDTATGITTTGILQGVALTTTTTDISSSTTYQLPLAAIYTNLVQVYSGSVAVTSNGTIRYNSYSETPTAMALTASSSSYSQTISSPSAASVTNLMSNWTATATRTATAFNASNVYTISTNAGVINIGDNTLATSPNAVPYGANYVITNYLGGKITAGLASGSPVINVALDYGNDGSIDNSYSIPFSSL